MHIWEGRWQWEESIVPSYKFLLDTKHKHRAPLPRLSGYTNASCTSTMKCPIMLTQKASSSSSMHSTYALYLYLSPFHIVLFLQTDKEYNGHPYSVATYSIVFYYFYRLQMSLMTLCKFVRHYKYPIYYWRSISSNLIWYSKRIQFRR